VYHKRLSYESRIGVAVEEFLFCVLNKGALFLSCLPFRLDISLYDVSDILFDVRR